MIDLYQFVAFIIDFEGCISIKKYPNKGFIKYGISVSISNTDVELLFDFKQIVKFGKIYGPYKIKEGNKDSYFWYMNKKEIKEYLPKILPFISKKWRQAEFVIEVSKIIKIKKDIDKLGIHKKQEIYTWEEMCIFESAYQECRLLNRKGI